MKITPELLSGLAGAILSLVLSYVPGLSGWWDTLAPDRKRLIMLALLALAAVGIYAADCYGLYATGVCGDWQGLVSVFLAALIANQSVYALSPQPGPENA